eukprot:Hpha_TRINITY_DN14217_c0_g1::TRINITY_DN14217_c0_g1_i1::g.22236::m.22236
MDTDSETYSGSEDFDSRPTHPSASRSRQRGSAAAPATATRGRASRRDPTGPAGLLPEDLEDEFETGDEGDGDLPSDYSSFEDQREGPEDPEVVARKRPPPVTEEGTGPQIPDASERIDIRHSVDSYLRSLGRLQVELNKLQAYVVAEKLRVVVLFEGRDTAGKGGCIRVLSETLNPRVCRVVALTAPSERESTQWYFQRYVAHLPAAGEIVLYDRSWYNRAGVERVMGFCTDAQYQDFLRDCPVFEKMLTDSGIILRKYWLDITREVQDTRLTNRIRVPTKRWKLSKMDLLSREKWGEYTSARDAMFEYTHKAPHAEWQVVDANSKMLARLNLIRQFLSTIPYRVVPHDIPSSLKPLGASQRELNICEVANPRTYRVVAPVFQSRGGVDAKDDDAA